MLYKGYKEAVRNVRVRNGWTQDECGERAGISGKKWSKYETGELKLTDDVRPIILKGLRCRRTELWQETVRVQRIHHFGLSDEIREEAPEYGTPMAAGVVQGIWALDVQALPVEERRLFSSDRNSLARILTDALDLVENLKEKYWKLTGRLRPAAEGYETPDSTQISEITDKPKDEDDDSY